MRIRDEWVRRQAGVVPLAALERWGNSRKEVAAAAARGDLVRLRRGWYALPGADADVVRAVRAGGCLGCVSVLRRHGVWTTDQRLHVRVAQSSQALLPRDVVRCTVPGLRRVPARALDDLPAALLAASQCCDEESFIAALDSVLHLRLMEYDELERLFSHSPASVRRNLARTDRAESGTETLARLRLRAKRIQVTPQVSVPDVGRVDFLIGESLVVEVDSVAHHTSLEAYERDRRRDRLLQAMGYTVVRVTYRQVMTDWDAVENEILGLMRRRRHRQRIVPLAA